jgi:hypothetical protein
MSRWTPFGDGYREKRFLDGSGCFGDLVCFVEVYVGQGLKARESGE